MNDGALMLSFFLFIPVECSFVVIAVLHMYWAVGAKNISSKVIPHIDGKPVFIPNKAVTFLVGVVFVLLAILMPLIFFDWNGLLMGSFYKISGSLLALVFLLRAMGDFHLVGFFKKIKNSEFARFDSCFWSPLCIFLAGAVGYLVWR